MEFNACILSGDGINCEKESAYAAKYAGFKAEVVHINDLLKQEGKQLLKSRLLVLPGGFSFGDELNSGKILALKLKHGLGTVLDQFIQNYGAILGICNGFQVLVRLGLFGKSVTLTQNEQGLFQNKWVGLKVVGTSIFTDPFRESKQEHLELPIRNGEGRLWIKDASEASEMAKRGQMVLQYETVVNGSWHDMAALSAQEGRILGMMPHPEAFWTKELHPWGMDRDVPLGVEFFKNAYLYFSKHEEQKN